MVYYHGKRRTSLDSVLEVFTLNPLPYPVLLILLVALIFLSTSWYFSFDETMESVEQQVSWILFVVPIALLLLARWLSSMDNPESFYEFFFPMNPWDRRRRTHHIPDEGSSPWGVAVLIVVLLVLIQFQSSFRESWLI